MRQALFTACALLLAAGSSPAASARGLPPGLEGVKFEPLLKEQIPPELAFRDERGRAVRLGDYFDGSRAVVLVLVQYRCPMLCGLVLGGLTDGLRELAGKRGFKIGEHFTVVTVSFDEREKPELAAAKKSAHVEAYGFPGAAAGWHFLTGDKGSIEKLTDKAGFAFRHDAQTDQFAHDTGILLLTPEGRISRFLPGIQFDQAEARDLYYGLVEASQFRIGQPIADRVILLFCYSYDTVRGTYQMTVMNVVRLAGLLTVLALAAFGVVMFRRERRLAPAPRARSASDGTVPTPARSASEGIPPLALRAGGEGPQAAGREG